MKKGNLVKSIQTFSGRLILLALFAFIILFYFSTSTYFTKNPNAEKFDEADGVIEFNKDNGFIRKSIKVYNFDGSLRDEFQFSFNKDDEIDESITLEQPKNIVNPFAFIHEEARLIFRVTRSSTNWIEVVIDEENQTKGYFRNSGSNPKIQTWNDYILKVTAVDTGQNTLFTEPNGKITENFEHKEIEKIPLEIQGDWMKIKLKAIPPEPLNDGKQGTISQRVANADGRIVWVKWRENGNILVYFFYSC